MARLIDKIVAAIWKRVYRRDSVGASERGSLDLGSVVRDGAPTRHIFSLSNNRRTMHLAVLGKTGSGKSSLLRYMAQQDVQAGRGFLYFDFHGDTIPFLLRAINLEERRLRQHLSQKLILIDPADPVGSVGFNPLEQEVPDFVAIADFTQVLKRRWQLDHFGARTDELLRNALFALSASGLTLIELSPFLSNAGFRTVCLKHVANADVREYFETRYDSMSEPMKASMREPILNKTSAFSSDPRFRHIVGQEKSTFSIRQAMDEGQWVLVNLHKGRLGEQALTLGSLIFTVLKNALFAREKRSLYTLYCDEIQNLVAFGGGIETMLSEARKFGVSVVSANQYLEQYPQEMRSAIMSVGTHIFFQLANNDAGVVAQMLDGGKPLNERLKNLPQRHAVVRSGAERWSEIRVPRVKQQEVDYSSLLLRARSERTRIRTHIEQDIAGRRASARKGHDVVLHDWE